MIQPLIQLKKKIFFHSTVDQENLNLPNQSSNKARLSNEKNSQAVWRGRSINEPPGRHIITSLDESKEKSSLVNVIMAAEADDAVQVKHIIRVEHPFACHDSLEWMHAASYRLDWLVRISASRGSTINRIAGEFFSFFSFFLTLLTLFLSQSRLRHTG